MASKGGALCSATLHPNRKIANMRHVLDDLLFTASTTKFPFIRIDPTSSKTTVYAADGIDKSLFLNAHFPPIDELIGIGEFSIGHDPKLLDFIRRQIINGDGDLSVSPDKTSFTLSKDGLVSRYYRLDDPSMAPKYILKSPPPWSPPLTILPTSSAFLAVTRTMAALKSLCDNQFCIKVADGFVVIELVASYRSAGSDLGNTCSIFRLCNTNLPDNTPIRYRIDTFLTVIKAARNDDMTVFLSPTTGLMQCSFSRDVAGNVLTYNFILPGRHT